MYCSTHIEVSAIKTYILGKPAKDNTYVFVGAYELKNYNYARASCHQRKLVLQYTTRQQMHSEKGRNIPAVFYACLL